ncbi:somatoliberin isoform X2 [Pleurodeles waltl]|uniref:somatoliberin isoform X2 n=1 Tax=Pleurodeles waltl TaxID=8319 RepID=UPI0037096B49
MISGGHTANGGTSNPPEETCYDQLPISRKAMSFQLQERDPVQSRDLSLEEQEHFLSDPTEKRAERHADAIFTNTYRKFLGQISARKFLQTIMGKRLGQGIHGEGGQEVLTRRQLDSILMDSHFHKQMAMKNVLAAILSNLSIQDINSDPKTDYTPSLSELLNL